MNNSLELDGELLNAIKENSFGEKYLYAVNRNSFDKISAQAIFESNFDARLFDTDFLYVVMGTDSGLLPKYIQEKGLPNGTRYIFIEPNSVLKKINEFGLIGDLDSRITCITLEDWRSTLTAFKADEYFYINSVRSFNSICAQDDYIYEYAELSWHINEVLVQLNWQYSTQLGAEAFIEKQIINLADNKTPAKILENAFQGKTVALLAGGPSLDEALPWICQHREQLVVFSVSRISRQLLRAGIEPDFVFSVDPQDVSFDVSKEMLTFSRRPVFIYSYHAAPTLVNQWHGPALYLGSRLPWKSPLNIANISGAGPTVTNTALNVAFAFGFKRIILAGVDLCFTKDGFTHAKGSDEQKAGPKFDLTSLQVETNSGFMAPTGSDYAQALNAFSAQAKRISATNVEIINISKNAAKIENVEYIPIENIQLDQTPIDISSILKSANIANTTNKFYDDILNELKRAQYQIRLIKSLAMEARQINDTMFNAEGQILNYKHKRRLDKIEMKFKRECRHYSKLVKKFGIRKFIKVTKPFRDEDWSADEVKELGNIFYDAYQEGADRLATLVEGSIQRIISRREELSKAPDFDLLELQWRKDKSYRRAKIWRENNPEVILSEAHRNNFNDMDNMFTEILNNNETLNFALRKKGNNLFFAKHRAGLLFKHRKEEELQNLLLSLEKHESSEESENYYYLASGYLKELQENTTEALEYYHKIIDKGDSLLEEALMRVTVISIDRIDNTHATLALECLSRLNPLYLPFYGEILRLHGETIAALDAYNEYIALFPKDILTQLKLVVLCIENKILDAAALMLDFILEQKPGLQAAVNLKKQLLELTSPESLATN